MMIGSAGPFYLISIGKTILDSLSSALFKGAQITVVLASVRWLSALCWRSQPVLPGFAGGPILSTIAVIYIEIFRGTSLLVQLFWLYYALPLIGISFDPITTGIMGLGPQHWCLWC